MRAHHLLASLPLLAAAAGAQVPQLPIESLSAPSPVSNEQLGLRMAIDADWLVAGLPTRTGTSTTQGVVVAWARSGASFAPATLVTAPTPGNFGQFGKAVELDGGELIVSEERSTHWGSPSRSGVHLFADVGGTWTHVDSIENPTGGFSNRFGASLARDGDLLAVGATYEVVQGENRGAVHLFRLIGGVWQVESLLTASDGAVNDYFGTTVAVSGDRVLVGAPDKRNGTAFEGAAYMFERIGGTWTETARFAVDPTSDDRGLGAGVGLDGTTAVVGAARTNDVGAVHVYDLTAGTWTQTQRIQPQGLSNSATFGGSVALDGDRLVVGAQQDTTGGFGFGTAWLFGRAGGAWTPRARLAALSGASLGAAVALDGLGTYAVAQPNVVLQGTTINGGLIQIYRPEDPIGTTYCTPVANSTQRAGRIAALGSEVAADDRLTLAAYELPNNSFGYFLTSRSQGSVQQPGGSQGILCLSGSIGRYVGAGQIQNTGSIGMFALALDLAQTPTPTGFGTITAGETWNFQTWHRDFVSGVGSTSNFTDAVSVAFQ